MSGSGRRGVPWSLRLSQVSILAFVVAIGFLVTYPVIMLLIGSFAPPAGSTAAYSLDGYRTALFDADARRAIWTSLWLTAVRAVLALALAVFLSWAITRTNVWGRKLFHNLLILSFFLPLLPQLVAWSLLLSPRSGIVNVWLRSLIGASDPSGPFNIYSYGGIIFVSVLGWAGFLYLFIAPAFQGMDSSVEEAARTSGANGMQLLRRITIPLLLPAILGAFSLAFVRMIESFQTELLLGTPAGIYVFTTQIFYYISQQQVPDYPAAIALSTLLIVLTSIVIIAQQKILSNRTYVTVSGKSYRRSPQELGAWNGVICSALVLFFAVRLVLPLGVLLLGSAQRSTNQFRMNAFTLDHWKVLADATVFGSLINTLEVGLVAATVGMLLTSLISYIVVRTNFRFRQLLDAFTWVPYMVPSFVLSIGFLWAVLKGIPTPFDLYGSLALLTIAFIVRLLPLGARLMNGTMVQLSPELEEAARMSGASWFSTFGRIVLPLVRPALTVGWLIFMFTVLSELDTVILLYGPHSQVLAVTFYSYWSSGATEDASVIGLFMTVVGLLLAAAIYGIGRRTGAAQQGVVF